MRAGRRVLTVLAALVLAVCVAAPAQASPESEFVSLINGSRSAAGLPPLQVHADLVDDARAWSQSMMNAGAISHNPNLGSVTTGWEALGENVGVGPDPGSLHVAFMGSPGHRDNILGDFTHVGVGVVVEAEGRIWVTVVFMRAVSAAAPTTTTTTTTTTVAAAAPQVTTTTAPSSSVPAPASTVKAATAPTVELGRPPSHLPFAV